jgi:hypothetical protein
MEAASGYVRRSGLGVRLGTPRWLPGNVTEELSLDACQRSATTVLRVAEWSPESIVSDRAPSFEHQPDGIELPPTSEAENENSNTQAMVRNKQNSVCMGALLFLLD